MILLGGATGRDDGPGAGQGQVVPTLGKTRLTVNVQRSWIRVPGPREAANIPQRPDELGV